MIIQISKLWWPPLMYDLEKFLNDVSKKILLKILIISYSIQLHKILNCSVNILKISCNTVFLLLLFYSGQQFNKNYHQSSTLKLATKTILFWQLLTKTNSRQRYINTIYKNSEATFVNIPSFITAHKPNLYITKFGPPN